MLVVVSPAKKLDMLPVDNIEPTRPLFDKDAEELAGVMQGLSVDKVKSMMGLSQNLAQLNADRFARFGSQVKKAAALAFAGDTYQGLEAAHSNRRKWRGRKITYAFYRDYMECCAT